MVNRLEIRCLILVQELNDLRLKVSSHHQDTWKNRAVYLVAPSSSQQQQHRFVQLRFLRSDKGIDTRPSVQSSRFRSISYAGTLLSPGIIWT